MSTSVDAPFYDETYGFLPAKASRLQEILHDYNPYISLVFIPPNERTDEDRFPFALLDTSPAHSPYIIRHISEREMEEPESVLAWLFEGDLSKHSVVDVMKKQELKQQAANLLEYKRQEDERQERIDLAAALAVGGRDKKHFYKHNGKTFRR